MYFTKKHLFLFIALLSFTSSFSQEKERIAKISYTLFRGDNADVPIFNNNGLKRNKILYDFSATYLLKNISKLHYHEFTLSRFFSEKLPKTGPGKAEEYLYAVKYEYGWIGAEINKFMELRYGGAIELYHGQNIFEPNTTQNYPLEQKATGVNLAFSPHLDIDITERFFIDFNPALMLFYYEIENNQAFNPTLPVRAQKQGGFEFGGGGFVIQVGMGYKL